MILVSIFLIIFIILGIIENYLHNKNLFKIKYRILVNGTRGKTTLSKIIIQALNDKGIKTIGRTTGSEAQIIFDDGSVKPFVRKKAARITEMIPFVRLCAKNKVECLVAECMALSEENQKIIADKLIKPTHVLIVNSYIDHIAEIGPDRDSTLYTLSKSVPKNAFLFGVDEEYKILGNKYKLAEIRDYDISTETSIHKQTLSLAISFLEEFGIDSNQVIEASKKISPDVGLHNEYKLNNGVFYPYFAINDYDTMKSVIENIGKSNKVNIIFNNRADREYRIKTFEKALYENVERVERVYLIGDYTKKVKRYLSHWCKIDIYDISAKELIEVMKNTEEGLFIGLGNIKGPGEEIVRYFIEENK